MLRTSSPSRHMHPRRIQIKHQTASGTFGGTRRGHVSSKSVHLARYGDNGALASTGSQPEE